MDVVEHASTQFTVEQMAAPSGPAAARLGIRLGCLSVCTQPEESAAVAGLACTCGKRVELGPACQFPWFPDSGWMRRVNLGLQGGFW